MMRSTRVRKLLVAGAVALAVVGCASSNQPSTEGSAPSGGQAGEPYNLTKPLIEAIKVDDALQAKLPEEAKTSTLKIGSNMQTPPNSYLIDNGQRPVGIDIDLVTATAARMGVQIELTNMEFQAIIPALESGRIAASIAGMNDTAERQKKIDFVDYFLSGTAVMIQKSNPENITKLEDLCGKPITLGPGTTQEAWAKSAGAKLCSDAGKGEMDLILNQTDAQRYNDLKTGRVVAALNDLPTLVYAAQTSGGGKDFSVLDIETIQAGPYGIGFNKKDTQLRNAFQASMQSLVDDGTYSQILKAWGVENAGLSEITINAGK